MLPFSIFHFFTTIFSIFHVSFCFSDSAQDWNNEFNVGSGWHDIHGVQAESSTPSLQALQDEIDTRNMFEVIHPVILEMKILKEIHHPRFKTKYTLQTLKGNSPPNLFEVLRILIQDEKTMHLFNIASKRSSRNKNLEERIDLFSFSSW